MISDKFSPSREIEDLVTEVFGPMGYVDAFENNSPYGLCCYPEFKKILTQWQQKTCGAIRDLLELARDGWLTEDRNDDGTVIKNELGHIIIEGRLHIFQIPSLLWNLGLIYKNQGKIAEAESILSGLGIYAKEKFEQDLVEEEGRLVNTIAT